MGAVCALIESRTQDIGIAAIHHRSMEIELTQFSDRSDYSRTEASVLALHPVALVVSRSARATQLVQILDKALGDAGMPEPIFTERRHFDEAFGQTLLEEVHVVGLRAPEFSAKYVACAALSALWHFVEKTMELQLLPSAVQVKFRSASDIMVIDSTTARLLELTTAFGNRKQGSLLDLFRCRTPGGLRLLRQALLQPLASKSEIELRQDAVQALLSNEAFFYELQQLLPAIGDIDLLAARLTSEPKHRGPQWCRSAIRTALKLRSALAALPLLAEALRGISSAEGPSTLLEEAHTLLTNASFPVLLRELDRVLDSEGPQALGQAGSLAHVALMYAVHPNVSPLLDIARQTWNDALQQIHTLHRGYMAKYPELRLKLEYTERRGWYLSHAQPSGPTEFLHTTAKGASGRQMSTTRDLNSENFKLRLAEQEILVQTVMVLSSLYEVLRAEAALLYRVSQIASALDLVQAFAGYALLGARTRPQLSDDVAAPMAIQGGRHPLLDQIFANEAGGPAFEPFDYFMDRTCCVQCITGANGGGKSTYLLSLAQLVVLSQAGCFIPAESATIRIVSSLLTRVGSSDSLEANASSFLTEAREVARILGGVSPESLVLIDELGRGAAHADGIALCWAVCERLVDLGVYTLFATHLHELCHLGDLFPTFRNMQLRAESDSSHVASKTGGHQFVVQHATCLKTLRAECARRYGLAAARTVGLPEELLAIAGRMADSVSDRLALRLPTGGRSGLPEAPRTAKDGSDSDDDDDDDGAVVAEAEAVVRELLALGAAPTAPLSHSEALRRLQAPWLDDLVVRTS